MTERFRATDIGRVDEVEFYSEPEEIVLLSTREDKRVRLTVNGARELREWISRTLPSYQTLESNKEPNSFEPE